MQSMTRNKSVIIYMLFVFFSNFSMMAQFLSAYLADAGFSMVQISSLFLIYQICKFVFEIPTGFVADKYGRKTSSLIGIVLLIFSYVLLAADNMILFYISFFTKGLAITFISGSMEAIFVESIDRNELVKYNTIERLVFYIAVGGAALVGGWAISMLGYEVILMIDIAFMALLFLIVWQVEERKKVSDEGDTVRRISFKECIRLAASNKILVLLLFMDLASAFAYVGVEDLYPAFLSELGMQSQYIGIFISAQLIVSAFSGLYVPKITKKINARHLFYLLPACRAFIIMPIYFKGIPLILIPVLYLAESISFVMYAPIKYDLFQKNIPDQYRSTIISFQSQAISLGAVLFYGLSSVLSKRLSMSGVLIIALFTAFLLNALCCYRIYRKKAL